MQIRLRQFAIGSMKIIILTTHWLALFSSPPKHLIERAAAIREKKLKSKLPQENYPARACREEKKCRGSSAVMKRAFRKLLRVMGFENRRKKNDKASMNLQTRRRGRGKIARSLAVVNIANDTLTMMASCSRKIFSFSLSVPVITDL